MIQLAPVPVHLPLDHLSELWPRKFHGARIGALLHPASVSAKLEHTSRILERHNGDLFRLAAFFGPQHGFLGQTQDNMVEWKSYEHPRLGVPVYSLYGEHREPTAEMLEGLEVLLVDLQDIGARYYTFIWTLYLCMRACEKRGVEVVVLDRPNPINGVTTEGPVLDPNYKSFVGMHPIPVRHGKTIGELAQQFRKEAFPECRLSILPMKNWQRAMWFDETGLPWVMPSPNMPTVDTAVVYPGTVLFEGTMLSEGRGTTRPFELVGAPWIEAEPFAASMNALELPGVYFRPAVFEPTFQKHARQPCGGCQIHVTDRDSFRPVLTGVALIDGFRRYDRSRFAWRPPPYEYEHEKLPIDILAGSDALRLDVEAGRPLEDLRASWRTDEEAFERVRQPYLLY